MKRGDLVSDVQPRVTLRGRAVWQRRARQGASFSVRGPVFGLRRQPRAGRRVLQLGVGIEIGNGGTSGHERTMVRTRRSDARGGVGEERPYCPDQRQQVVHSYRFPYRVPPPPPPPPPQLASRFASPLCFVRHRRHACYCKTVSIFSRRVSNRQLDESGSKITPNYIMHECTAYASLLHFYPKHYYFNQQQATAMRYDGRK